MGMGMRAMARLGGGIAATALAAIFAAPAMAQDVLGFQARLQRHRHGARPDHGVLRRHAGDDGRLRQLLHPDHDRGAGHGLPASEQHLLLADLLRLLPADPVDVRRWRAGARVRRGLDLLSAAVDHGARRAVVRPGDLLAARRGRLVDPGRDQLHHHHLQHARPGHDPAPHAAVRLGRADHRLPAADFAAGSGGRHHHAADGPVYSDPAGLRHDLAHRLDLLEEADLRLPRDGLRHGRHRLHRLHRVGAPHVYGRHEREPARLFRGGDHDHRRAHGREDLQLDRHHVGRLDHLQDAHAVGDGLHLPVHRRRRDRRGPVERRHRLQPARHLLRRGALPLCAVAGRHLLDLRRLLLLVREDVRGEVQRVPGPGALLDHVHRREPDLLPATLPGPAGHAAALRRLSGSLHLLEPRFLGGLCHHHRRRRRLHGDAAGVGHPSPQGRGQPTRRGRPSATGRAAFALYDHDRSPRPRDPARHQRPAGRFLPAAEAARHVAGGVHRRHRPDRGSGAAGLDQRHCRHPVHRRGRRRGRRAQHGRRGRDRRPDAPHPRPSGRRRTRAQERRHRLRHGAVGLLGHAVGHDDQLAGGGAAGSDHRLLRLALHPGAEAPDAAEYRHRRSGGRLSPGDRLGGRDGRRPVAGLAAVPDHLHLDAAAHLGPGPLFGRGLRQGGHSDDAGGARRQVHPPADPALHPGLRAGGDRPGADGAGRADLSGGVDRRRRGLPGPGAAALSLGRGQTGPQPVRLFHSISYGAVLSPAGRAPAWRWRLNPYVPTQIRQTDR
uniref:NADH-ubiquinone oxidoreductase chain N n=1 Tax=Parastrongyloides trichosuri TaxID=131310 RepID=A0A0N5A107_PARTI